MKTIEDVKALLESSDPISVEEYLAALRLVLEQYDDLEQNIQERVTAIENVVKSIEEMRTKEGDDIH